MCSIAKMTNMLLYALIWGNKNCCLEYSVFFLPAASARDHFFFTQVNIFWLGWFDQQQ
jgi:hypothetical protein